MSAARHRPKALTPSESRSSLGLPSDWLREEDISRSVHGGFPPEEPPNVVYHYTPAAGLLGIVKSGQLWVTDVEFLNDSQELSYAGENLLRALRVEEECLALLKFVGAGSSPDPEVMDELSSFLARRERWGRHKQPSEKEAGPALVALQRIIMGLHQMKGSSRSTPLHVYVTCFCEEGDLLSQWRGYGGAGGYSIGFNRHALETVASLHSRGEFLGISYGFRDAVRLTAGSFFPEYLHRGISLLGDYLKAVTMIKNPAFREEREWRLMIPREDILDDVEFRIGPLGVTPYLEVPFAREEVTDVIVGPGHNPAERMNGTRQLLDRYGMQHVDVQPSQASLRLS
ncbi:DUF2971 domain-containing protein [Streptomyces sp. NPDC015684]|uniref:DUF2971 domain-containing protein n=1 Tax=Streptomyces sp. NPDC015684 TaxID=3364963 RepID=UPI003702CC7F